MKPIVGVRTRVSWNWQACYHGGERRVGGPPPPLSLNSTMHYEFTYDGVEWQAFPIVEDPKPENPRLVEERAMINTVSKRLIKP